jgi:Arc/MetJ-type ribon-helix-helix transcriptional regulator
MATVRSRGLPQRDVNYISTPTGSPGRFANADHILSEHPRFLLEREEANEHRSDGM